MANDAWRPVKWNDPELSGVPDRYTVDIRRDIVTLARITPEKSDLFLRLVIGVGCLLHIELVQHQDRVTAAERRDMLQALSDALESAERQAHALPGVVRREFELEARIAQALSTGEASSRAAGFTEPTNWITEDGETHTTPGRPSDQDIREWARTGAGPFFTSGEHLVEAAIDQIKALNQWTKTCVENLPPVRRARPNEIIVRRAVRQLLRTWKRHSKLPPTARGPFSRFTEVTLRPALQGYWPEQRGFERAIKDVIKEEKLRATR